MNTLFQTKSWLSYQLKAHYRHGHHVHSPYTYHLFTNVLFERWHYYSFARLENTRRRISPKTSSDRRFPADRPKYNQLLQRLCATNSATTIIEIGRTSGISTMYLASNDSRSTVFSLSDDSPTDLFRLSGYNNIQQLPSDRLPSILSQIDSLDMLVVKSVAGTPDIYHIYNLARERQRDGSIFVFEGIHSSPERESQWNSILHSPDVTLSIDLFHLGIVWLRRELRKQHYIVKY